MTSDDKIHWAPKVPQAKIWRLYQSSASGIVDAELIDDVGGRLHDRCRSVILVSRGQVECPRCGAVFATHWHAKQEDAAISCSSPGCGWETTGRRYHDSWRHRDLIGTNALPAFEEFVERYLRATTPPEQMLLIDRLIHVFHWGLKTGVPHRSAANNLIEGSHAQVVALLDRLTYGAASSPEQRNRREAWRSTVQAMRRRR